MLREIDQSPRYIARLLVSRLSLPVLGEALLIVVPLLLLELCGGSVAILIILVYFYFDRYIDPLINFDSKYSCLSGFVMLGTQVIAWALAFSLLSLTCHFLPGLLVCTRNPLLLSGSAVIVTVFLWLLLMVWRFLDSY